MDSFAKLEKKMDFVSLKVFFFSCCLNCVCKWNSGSILVDHTWSEDISTSPGWIHPFRFKLAPSTHSSFKVVLFRVLCTKSTNFSL